ncbi:MAG: hypothetical protein K2X29_15095 [Candidatus Obscuribacterales bacterium]|nr:hypothetical protein [Candidatus Obscuribacterales bacterium]
METSNTNKKNTQCRLNDLADTEQLTMKETSKVQGGSTVSEMERVMTFDHGYGHKQHLHL